MANLFKKAVQKAPAAKVKDDKTRIRVEDPKFFENVKKLEELNDVLKKTKASADMISDEIRDISKNEWIDLYQTTGRNPGSVMIECPNGLDMAQLMFVPSDRYITVNKQRAEELQEQYGADIITENIAYGIDQEMVDKYGEILSELIENCSLIPERDRERLITAKPTYSIAKGTIDKLPSYGDVAEMMETIRPVVALKGVEVVKG